MGDFNPYAQWFERLGTCGGCGKAATGTLRSYHGNSSLGPYCERCANRDIKKAHRKGRFEPDAALPAPKPEGGR